MHSETVKFIQVLIFTKISPVRAELFDSDGQTD